MAEKFTWLASYPKSGNTWVRMLIHAYYQNGYVDINHSPYTFGDQGEYWLRAVSPLPPEDLGEGMKLMLRPACLLNQLASMVEEPRLIKTHYANARVSDLPHFIPHQLTERAVYIVRDPRDVVTSLADYVDTSVENAVSNMNNDTYALQNEYGLTHYLASWSTHVRSWIQEERYPVAVLKYEDLLGDTLGEFIQLLEFLKIDIDEKRAARAVKACEISKLQHQEAKKGFREDKRQEKKPNTRFFRKGGSRWLKELDPKFANQIEEDHKSMMEVLGYLNTASLKATG